VKLDLVHGRDLWPVKVDVSQFEQVIVNLAVNARDAMPDGGKLTVRTGNVTSEDSGHLAYKGMPAADYVRIDVVDTGTGIPAEIVDKIFEPFFSTKEVGKGTGLGLSTVYGIVKQTGGFIYVDSEANQGTSFHIFLPRHHPALEVQPDAAAANGAAKEPTEAKPRTDLTGQGTILLVEDEEGLRSLNARGLRSRGYREERCGGSRGFRRGDAGNGWPDPAQGDARPQSGPQDHLRVRLCGRCLREEPARKSAVRVPAKTFHAQPIGGGGEGNHDAVMKSCACPGRGAVVLHGAPQSRDPQHPQNPSGRERALSSHARDRGPQPQITIAASLLGSAAHLNSASPCRGF
jgi:hypothetical protein